MLFEGANPVDTRQVAPPSTYPQGQVTPSTYPPLQPPAYSQHFTSSFDMDQFKAVVREYEISEKFAMKLRQIEGFEIVIIADDSGSMNNPVKPLTAFSLSQSRWEELKNTVGTVARVATIMDPDGIDVYFLNRDPQFHVKNVRDLEHSFRNRPDGYTPIGRVFSQVLSDKRSVLSEKKLLIIVATDGLPTDDYGTDRKDQLYAQIRDRYPIDKIYVTFIACTDDEEAVLYMNKLDKEIKNVDTIDDYQSEKAEIQKAQGSSFPFSYGDYIVKALIGSVDPEFDNMDEPGWGSKCVIM